MRRNKRQGKGFGIPLAILSGIASDLLMSRMRGSGMSRKKMGMGRRHRRLRGRGFFSNVWKFIRPHLPKLFSFGSELAKEGISSAVKYGADKLSQKFPKQEKLIRSGADLGQELGVRGVNYLSDTARNELLGGYVRVAGRKYAQGGYARIAGRRRLTGASRKRRNKMKRYGVKYGGSINPRPENTIQF